MKLVLVFGTFDVLHPGHLNFFKQAKALGDELHVIIALDQTVLQVKSKEPLQSEEARLRAVLDVDMVDYAYLGNKGDKFKVIEAINPDIIALGYDQRSFTHNLELELKKRGVECEIARMESFYPEKYKSSLSRDQLIPPAPFSCEEKGGLTRAVSASPWLVEASRQLRKKQTPAEVVLWKGVRNRRLGGYKFLRQHPIGRYVVDFYCHEAKLIVEIDGSVHLDQEVKEKDQFRQKELEQLGYNFVRFTNNEIFADIEKVILILLDILAPLSSQERGAS